MGRARLTWLLAVAIALFWTTLSHAQAPAVVWLHRPEEPIPDSPVPHGLDLEMIRQAVLLSAREELGQFTRDERLGEPLPADPAVQPITTELTLRTFRKDPNTLILRIDALTNGKNTTNSLQLALSDIQPGSSLLPHLQAMEKLTHNSLIELLQSSGLTGRSTPQGNTTVPPDIVQRLEQMNYFSQYDAALRLHWLIRTKGASPETLGALSRAYAHLGFLTQQHTNSAYRVFQARSLLYAQRAISLAPDAALPRYYRAYAAAIAGLHAIALDDLQAAAAHQDSAPTWADVIQPLCAYDTKTLLQLGQRRPELRPIASSLVLETIRTAHNYPLIINVAAGEYELNLYCAYPLISKIAVEGYQSNPYCFRLLDAAAACADLQLSQKLTEQAFPDMVTALRTELPRLQEVLPPSVAQAWADAHKNPNLQQDVASVAKAMSDSLSPDEPSWACLGDLIAQSNFLHVMKRAQCMAMKWNLPTDEYLDQSAPLVANHPLRQYLDSFRDDVHESPQKRRAIFTQLHITDPSRGCRAIVYDMRQADAHSQASELNARIAENGDGSVAYDQEDLAVAQAAGQSRADAALNLTLADDIESISPLSPTPAALRIQANLPRYVKQLPLLQQKFGHTAMFSKVAGTGLFRARRYAEATPLLQTWVELSPDCNATVMLASCYLAQHDEAKWLSTLNAYLDREGPGLNASRIRRQITKHFMEKAQYDLALPYTITNAQESGSQEANAAAICYEATGDLDRALLWHTRNAERRGIYQGLAWFCRRNNLGDYATAKEGLARQYKKRGKDDYDLQSAYATLLLLDGDADQALAQFTRLARTGDSYFSMHLALLQDTRNDVKLRDAELAKLARDSDFLHPAITPLARAMQDALTHNTPLNLQACETTWAKLTRSDRTDLHYFAARFLLNRGDTQRAQAQLQACIAEKAFYEYTYTLARQLLTSTPATQPATTQPVSLGSP